MQPAAAEPPPNDRQLSRACRLFGGVRSAPSVERVRGGKLRALRLTRAAELVEAEGLLKDRNGCRRWDTRSRSSQLTL